jgi:RNA polymerase sigma-70 factor, ECF subfamily
LTVDGESRGDDAATSPRASRSGARFASPRPRMPIVARIATALATFSHGSHTPRAMPASAARSDEDLMLAYAAGDAAAFDILYARHKGGVYRYLLRQCSYAGIADELFQDVWMNLIRARRNYVASAKFTTYVYKLAHNRLIDYYRANGKITLISADDESHADAVNAIAGDSAMQPEWRAENRELGDRLRTAVEALPPAQRDAFLLQYEAGLSLAEIAELSGIGIETIKSRLRYASNKLRSDLSDLYKAQA